MLDKKLFDEISTLTRIETTDKNSLMGQVVEKTHAVYPHEQIYGDFCPVHSYINCPPEKVFNYMNDTLTLEEWTYSLRNFKPHKSERHGDIYTGSDAVEDNTDIYVKTVSNKDALTVDYHCAWDQGEELWMIYLNRIVPADLVLNKPGSVVFWQNCRHPYYENNPFKDKAPHGRAWIGDFWDFFYAGHTIELENLKLILEYKHENNLI